jgi:hypothetical protein
MSSINPLFLSQLGAENAQGAVQVNMDENQGVKDCDDNQLALSWHQVGTKLALSQSEVYSILRFCEEAQTLLELLTLMRLKDRTKFRKKYLYPLLEFGAIQLTIPDKPKSKNQKYRLTAKGLQLKELLEKNK